MPAFRCHWKFQDVYASNIAISVSKSCCIGVQDVRHRHCASLNAKCLYITRMHFSRRKKLIMFPSIDPYVLPATRLVRQYIFFSFEAVGVRRMCRSHVDVKFGRHCIHVLNKWVSKLVLVSSAVDSYENLQHKPNIVYTLFVVYYYAPFVRVGAFKIKTSCGALSLNIGR